MPARRLRHGRLRFLSVDWFAFGLAGFGLSCFCWALLCPAPFDSVRLAVASFCEPEVEAGPRYPFASVDPELVLFFGQCSDGRRLVTNLRVPVRVPSRSSAYGKHSGAEVCLRLK